MTEQNYGVDTSGNQQGWHDSLHNHRYEPTPFAVLEQMRSALDFTQSMHWIDYGCGKGRLSFWLHNQYGTRVTGIEMDESLLHIAHRNKTNYERKTKRQTSELLFVHAHAEEASVPNDATHFYFFNPFSVQIFQRVFNRILCSVEQNPRTVTLILYFPQHAYRTFLNAQWGVQQQCEIQTGKSERDCVVIYQLKMGD